MNRKAFRYASICFLIIFAFSFLVSCEETSSDQNTLTSSTTAASITLTASPSSVSADGTSSSAITASLQDSSDNACPEGTSVSFATTLGTFSNGYTTYNTSTPDSNGTVTVSLIAGTIAGTATITGTSNNVTQTVEVEFTAGTQISTTITSGQPASIEVYSTERDPVSIKESGLQETSKIIFVVKDDSGLKVGDGYTINFSIDGGGIGGGESLDNATDTTLAGYVETTLQSGTKAGTVKIKAEWASDPTVSTNTNITIAGGPPYGEHLGLDPGTLNIAGLVYAGLEDAITMRGSDKYFNEVPDGTSVYFTSDYAMIKAGQDEVLTTGSAATSTLVSQVPYPPDGFVTPSTFTQSGAYARVLCMATHPTDTNVMYLGTDGGGIFKSDDGGTNWYEVGAPDKGFTNGMVWDIRIDPGNPAIVYAATDDGIFRSTGSGDEWEKISGFKEITGETLGTLDVTDANNDGYSDQQYSLTYSSNLIRSKTHVYLNGSETYDYIYTSGNTIRFIVLDLAANNGNNITIDYTTPSMLPSAYPVRAIALDPSSVADPANDRVLYAGTYGKGVYRSADAGFSWTAKNSGLDDQDVLSLAIDPTNTNILYVGTKGGGVFKTTNAADSWTSSNSGLPGSVIPVITIDPNTTSRLYVGTDANGVYYSTDSGATWTAPSTNVTSTQVTKIVLDSTANPAQEIYAATYGDGTDPLGGVYKSSNGGTTWSRLTALQENHVHALGINAGATDTLFAGTWGRNVFKSTDGGTTWSSLKGSAPDELTNQIFATTEVLFSGNTAVSVIQTATTGQGAGGDDYLNDASARSVIYNAGSASFIYTVQDQNGNPLIEGTTISVSVDQGEISGDTSVTLPDMQGNQNYSLTWKNNITGSANKTGTITIAVTSDNGDVTATVTRTLLRPVAVSISPSSPAVGNTVTVIPSGGSETVDNTGATNSRGGYTVVHPQGTSACSYGSTVTYTVQAAQGDTEMVRVKDDITGEYAELTYTVQ